MYISNVYVTIFYTVYVHARETEVSSLHLDLLPSLRLLRNWLYNWIREPTVSPRFALWILKSEGKEKVTWDWISPSSIQRTHSASPRSSRRLIILFPRGFFTYYVRLCCVSTLKSSLHLTCAVLLYLIFGCTRMSLWVILQNLGTSRPSPSTRVVRQRSNSEK